MLSFPLGQHILDYEPPHGFVIPPFTMYDGSSDPYDHMLHFNQAMILNAGDDRILCKVFPASLKGPTLAWFHKLPRGSINSFSELWAVFVSQYLCSVRQKGNINSLQAILKREDESIRDFTRKIGQAVQQNDIYSMDAVFQNFRRSFGPTTPFFQSLSLDPPATMEELYWRADKFSTLEDNIRAASQTIMITTESGKPATKGSSEQKRTQNKGHKRPNGQSEKRKVPPPPPQFTPLNIAYDRLLPFIGDLPDFKWPPPMRAAPDQRKRSLRCDYHRDHGHETNHCQSLKFLVEKLIRAGHLIRYIREPTHEVAAAPTTDRVLVDTEHASGPRPAINFILGGPVDSQYQSKNQRRKMLRAALVRARVNTLSTRENTTAAQPIDGPISFPPFNPTRVITPHYDALVLTVCINNFDVHRVLVDPSSAADLLHLPALKQMRIPLDHLSSVGIVLSRFNGATTLTIGDIAFPVRAGPVTHQVLFSVVKDLGPYNAILGKTWLPSTYHQTVSYLIASGQVDLQGSQLAAW